MNKKLQHLWDSLLVDTFKFNKKMGWVVYKFMQSAKPEFVRNNIISDEGWEWFNSLELKRCRDRDYNGVLRFYKHKQKTQDFIGSHCLLLMLALLDKKIDNAEILKNIKLYKWKRHNQKSRVKSRTRAFALGTEKRRKELEVKSGCKMKIHTRARDYSSNWSTVK